MNNRRFTLDAIKQNLKNSNSNLVFLQEVIGDNQKPRDEVPNWSDNNQFEFLADSIWDYRAYGKNAIYQHGHHGNAILSELPFVKMKNFDVSTMRISQRGILHGILENGVHLLCVHLGLFESERKAQISKLIAYSKSAIDASEPLIVAGDFNDWRNKAHPRLCDELGLSEANYSLRGRAARTFPSRYPLLPMDRIYVRGFAIKSARVMADPSWAAISDHCAVTAEVQLLR